MLCDLMKILRGSMPLRTMISCLSLLKALRRIIVNCDVVLFSDRRFSGENLLPLLGGMIEVSLTW
jgi:hypothetical protein